MASRKRADGRKKKRDSRHRGKSKRCYFCENALVAVDYKDVDLLRRFMSERGKISPRRNTGTCAQHQRLVAAAVKRARHVALVPFVREYYR